MGQAPYGTSGLCPHTESPHSEAAYAATEVANTCYCGSATPDAFLFGWTGGADGFEGFGSSRDFGMEDVINFKVLQ
jgi:hypothetical protein